MSYLPTKHWIEKNRYFCCIEMLENEIDSYFRFFNTYEIDHPVYFCVLIQKLLIDFMQRYTHNVSVKYRIKLILDRAGRLIFSNRHFV